MSAMGGEISAINDNSQEIRAGTGFPLKINKSLSEVVVLRRFVSEFVFLLALCAAGLGSVVGVLYWIQPEIDSSMDLYALNRPASFTFLDQQGNVAGHHGVTVGDRVRLDELPSYVPAAFIAVEDQNFYDHPGIDIRAIARALIADIRAGAAVQGGSTITQQLSKMLFYSPERTLARKFRELSGAWALESHLSKTQILELYLNRIYLGSGAYGVDGAAQVYFGKSARDMTLAEAAMLAALTRAPSSFTPRRDLDAAQNRATVVLNLLAETAKLTAGEIAEARANPAEIVDRKDILERAYFFDVTAEEVKRLLPNAQGDLIVRTTFDQRMQDAARAALNGILDERGEDSEVSQAALVSMSADGALYAIVGGRDYLESPFNRATQARRQPGSSFKPFVYLAALESGLRPNDVRSGNAVNIRGYRPGNYGGRNWGYLTLSNALKHSVNTVAVRVANEIGIANVAEAAQRVGINSTLHTYPSLPLGTSEVSPFEITSAFATFASGGLKASPYSVLQVTTPRGETLYERGTPDRLRVVESDIAAMLNQMLYGVVESGTARAARIPEFEVAGKTGTSSDWRDAWFIGFTSQLVTGVWVGNDDFTPMKRVTGGSIPAAIWNAYMSEALTAYEPAPLQRDQPGRRDLVAANDVDLIYGGENQRGARGGRESLGRRELQAQEPPRREQRRRNGRRDVPEPPPIPQYGQPIDPQATTAPPEEYLGYRRGRNFPGSDDIASSPVEPADNPYEQEWYLSEQRGRAPQSAPEPEVLRTPAPEVYRGGSPRIYTGPNGLIYSMDPVGR